MKEIKLEQFSGPLDLLLQLIEEQELDISQIALSQVTEQYFHYLDKLEENRSEELADFLVIATKLVYLKSRQLLPQLAPEEEEGPSLADQLKMYKRYLEASKEVNKRWMQGKVAYGRLEPPVKPEGFVLPVNAREQDLRESFVSLLKRLKPINPLPKVSIDRAITVKQKIESIFEMLKNRKTMNFSELLAGAESKTDIIISFLAVLELVKVGSAAVKQTGVYGNLEISKI